MATIGLKTVYTEFISNRLNPAYSPIESFADDHCYARRTILVDWNTRQQALVDIMPYPQVVGAAHSLSRHVPWAYPDYLTKISPFNAGLPYMWATKIDPIEGIGSPDGALPKIMKAMGLWLIDGDMPQFKKARMTVHFNSLPYDILSDDQMAQGGFADESSLARYMVKEYDPAGQMITMPRGSMKFVGGDSVGIVTSAVNLSPPKYIPYWNVRLTHIALPESAVNSALYNRNLSGPGTIDTTLGHVNDADFPAIGPWKAAFPQGSLLYVAARIRPYVSPLGFRLYDVAHMFQFARVKDAITGTFVSAHNFVPFKSGALFGWIELSTDGIHYADTVANIGKHIYDAAPFPPLFTPP